MSQQRQRDYPEVRAWLVQRLRFAQNPVTRDDLAVELAEHASSTWGYVWSAATAGRRLREAVKSARRYGFPVVSLGGGFSLAADPAELTRAADRLRQIGLNLLAEASLLRRIRLSGDPAQEHLCDLGQTA